MVELNRKGDETMCGRYYFDTSYPKLQEILNKAHQTGIDFKEGEICPTQYAPVLICHQNKIYSCFKRWGYQLKIINARQETIHQRMLFRDDFKKRRCIIPMSYFFEWDKHKTKHAFGNELYLAGFYNTQNEFTILTTESQGDLKPIHHRMPVCIEKEHIKDYLTDNLYATQIIQTSKPPQRHF